MAKKPARKALMNVVSNSTVMLSIGDKISDGAQVSISISTEAAGRENARRVTTGLTIHVELPEGAVVADPEAAKTMARQETATILRKLAAEVLKGPKP